MNKINPTDSFNFEYRDNYITTVEILQYDDLGNTVYECILHEAYPTSIQSMPSTWADDQFQKVQVTMCYRYWTSEQVNKTIQSKSYADVKTGDPPNALSPTQTLDG